MAQGAKTAKASVSAGDRRRQRLAAELRSNLAKRKQQARGRAVSEEPAEAPRGGRPDK